MSIHKNFLPARVGRILAIIALGLTGTVLNLSAATVIWSGTSTTDTNWSTGLNWFGGVPPASADDVKFFDTGAVTVPLTPNNLVDVSYGIGSLQFGQTNLGHTISIAAGQTLFVTNGNLVVGTPNDVGVVKNLTNAISGAGGTLIVSNAAAVIAINQGTATSVTGTRGNLDLSGLDIFVANVKAIGLGSTVFTNPGNALQREAGSLILAKTNFITLAMTDTLANYQLAGKTNALELSRNPGNNAGILSQLILGRSNVINVDSMGFGRDKASASSAGIMAFNPAFTNGNPVAVFRGAAGGSSRVTWWAVGDMNANASSAQLSLGTNDFSNGTVDALVDTMSLGRDCSPQHTATGFIVGVLTFTAGTLDVNNLIAGNQTVGPNTSLAGMLGIVNVNGAAAKLVVNNTLELGHTTVSFVPGTLGGGTNAAKTYGILNIRNGGTAQVNRIIAGANSTNQNAVTLNSGTLVLTNGIGSPTKGVMVFAATNSTLRLNITGITNIICTNLVSAGATNIINLDSVAVFATYPKTISLIKFTSQLGVGVTNFGLGTIPTSAPGAYITNNVANSSLDLVLPFDPRPVFTAQPSPYSGSPGDNVTSSFAVTISAGSVTPLGYQWYYVNGGTTNLLADGAGPSGSSVLTGSTAANLQIANAQPGDSGNYFVVVTNLYGVSSSSLALLTISAGAVPPAITGPLTQTATNGVTTIIANAVSGSPVPVVYWQYNGVNLADGVGPSGSSTISGSSGASLTISNPQYPGDQGTYSLIASNSAGFATNNTLLTVIVPPAITSQPASLTVTNTQAASFTVVATGVPLPTYQWNKNGSPISPAVNSTATNATFAIGSVSPADTSTNYTVTITNPAGTTNSVAVSLIVNSTMGVAALAPNNSQTGVCYDTPFYLTFDAAPVLRTAGKIKIFNVANSVTPVDTLDLGLGSIQGRTIAGETINTYPVIIAGNKAAIYPHLGVLTSNQTYYVTIDNGVFTDATGAYFVGISANNVWQFSTKPGGAANPASLVVAQDYSGDFATLQGALDSLAVNNASPILINVRNGVYTEFVEFKKNNVVVRGQSRAGTQIGYANNSVNNANTHTRMALKVNANDIALDNLTITNMTPQGGSQAEALMIETGAARIIINNCNLASYQDTILANTATSKAYFNNSLIQGDVDFIWGGGNLFFTNCEVRYLLRAGNSGAAGPNPSPQASEVTSNQFSFINCRFTTPPNATNDTIGRTRSITGANMALITCFMSTNLAGWGSDALPTNNYRNWYYNCTNDLGGPITLSNGIALTSGDPNLALASSAPAWLYNWQPQLAPNILTQPANQSVSASQAANFNVSATGIPEPAYQWLKNGTPISGATGAGLTIPSAVRSNAGSYSVVVSNGSGSVTSSVATLTYTGNVTPTTSPASYVRAAGYSLKIPVTALATNWADADGDALALSGAISSTNGATVSYDADYVYYNNPNSVADEIDYTVSDGFGGTAAGVIALTVSTNPIAGSPQTVAIVGGSATVNFAGIPTYNYAIQRSTNLVDWVTLMTTNAPASGTFQFTDSFADLGGNVPATAFYRSALP